MGDKTCGTCKHGVPVYGCGDGDEIVFVVPAHCGEWEERADSVERVRAARIEEVAKRAVWILAHHPDSSHTFVGSEMEAELRALGVVE